MKKTVQKFHFVMIKKIKTMFLPYIGINITFWISLICLNCLLIRNPYVTIKQQKGLKIKKIFTVFKYMLRQKRFFWFSTFKIFTKS